MSYYIRLLSCAQCLSDWMAIHMLVRDGFHKRLPLYKCLESMKGKHLWNTHRAFVWSSGDKSSLIESPVWGVGPCLQPLQPVLMAYHKRKCVTAIICLCCSMSISSSVCSFTCTITDYLGTHMQPEWQRLKVKPLFWAGFDGIWQETIAAQVFRGTKECFLINMLQAL